MAHFVRFLVAEGTALWGMVNNEGNFLVIDGDRYTEYNITDTIVEPDSVAILPPSNACKIIAVGLNYKDHAKEMGMDEPDEPLLFMKGSNAIIGHKDTIILPEESKQVDYEAELAIVIKNDIKNISEDEVEKNVLGYTCFNDVTARDLQKKDGQWTRAKSFDTFAPCGPFVTKKIDPDNVDIKLYLNGELKQSSNTSNFIFKTKKLVSYISKMMTLNRGDIITTGTPGGIGAMKSGDTVEVEIEGIGKLTNYVK